MQMAFCQGNPPMLRWNESEKISSGFLRINIRCCINYIFSLCWKNVTDWHLGIYFIIFALDWFIEYVCLFKNFLSLGAWCECVFGTRFHIRERYLSDFLNQKFTFPGITFPVILLLKCVFGQYFFVSLLSRHYLFKQR